MPVQKVFNGTDWISVDGGGGASGDYIEGEGINKIFVSGTQPTVSENGDLWLDTNSQSASGIAYLPLSAGSNHPLSGNLVVDWDTSGDVQREIQLKADGNHVGKILETYDSSSANGFGFYKTDTQNSATHGITLDSNGTNVVSGNNNNVYIRPNGYGNSTGQVYWDTDGVQHGGFPVTYGTVSVNFWGESSNQQWEKYGRIIHLRLMRDFASARSNYGTPGTIVTLPTNLLPRTTVRASGVAFIDNVTWGGGTYYPVVISISTAGEMAVFGNSTYMVRCVGIQAEFSYVSAN